MCPCWQARLHVSCPCVSPRSGLFGHASLGRGSGACRDKDALLPWHCWLWAVWGCRVCQGKWSMWQTVAPVLNAVKLQGMEPRSRGFHPATLGTRPQFSIVLYQEQEGEQWLAEHGSQLIWPPAAGVPGQGQDVLSQLLSREAERCFGHKHQALGLCSCGELVRSNFTL